MTRAPEEAAQAQPAFFSVRATAPRLTSLHSAAAAPSLLATVKWLQASAGRHRMRFVEAVDSPLQHMTAGAVAGMTEHLAMFPVDTVKTRMQALSHPGQRALRSILRREGVAGLYSGVGAAALGAGPAHAVYFATYELSKSLLGADLEGHRPVAAACSGAVATLLSDFVATPLDVVKQRLQVAHTPYRGIAHCIQRVLMEEGPGAFFRSYRTTVFMNVPYTAVHFATYESLKKFLGPVGEKEGLLTQLLAGGLAGGLAAALTTPLDVVKTRLQLEGVNAPKQHISSAILPAIRKIVREEGRASLLAGLRPRVLFHAPAAAICWGTYETVKLYLLPL